MHLNTLLMGTDWRSMMGELFELFQRENRKNLMLLIAAIILILIAFFIEGWMEVNAKPTDSELMKVAQSYDEPFKIRCTCYTANSGAITRSGQAVREGIVAGKLEWLGMTAILYEVAEDGSCGDPIGYFEFLDTGYGMKKKDESGKTYGTIQAGESIDVFRNTLDACYDWIGEYGDYIYIQFLPGAEG